MPIRPENKALYPKDWKQIRQKILEECCHTCEFCGVANYHVRENGSKVVLTIAHLDQNPTNNKRENLKALCQQCHNRHDMPYRVANRKTNRERKGEIL